MREVLPTAEEPNMMSLYVRLWSWQSVKEALWPELLADVFDAAPAFAPTPVCVPKPDPKPVTFSEFKPKPKPRVFDCWVTGSPEWRPKWAWW